MATDTDLQMSNHSLLTSSLVHILHGQPLHGLGTTLSVQSTPCSLWSEGLQLRPPHCVEWMLKSIRVPAVVRQCMTGLLVPNQSFDIQIWKQNCLGRCALSMKAVPKGIPSPLHFRVSSMPFVPHIQI